MTTRDLIILYEIFPEGRKHPVLTLNKCEINIPLFVPLYALGFSFSISTPLEVMKRESLRTSALTQSKEELAELRDGPG